MKKKYLVTLLMFFAVQNFVLSQTPSLAKDLNISKQTLVAFQKDAEDRKNQFIECIMRVSRNRDSAIRNQSMRQGVALFEDTAHVGVSNKNTKKITWYTVRRYFYNVVSNYYNEFIPAIIEITSTPVIIDEVERDKAGNPIALIGHFEYTQKTTRCKGVRPQPNSDVPLYTDCYHDITTKTGQVRIKPRPTSKGDGYHWVILISGITVDTTE